MSTAQREGAPPRTAYTVPEVAAALQISRAHAYRLCAAQTIPSFRLGTSVRVHVADFHAFEAAHRAAS